MTLIFLSIFLILYLSKCFFVLKSFENSYTVYLWFLIVLADNLSFQIIFVHLFFNVTEFRTTLLHWISSIKLFMQFSNVLKKKQSSSFFILFSTYSMLIKAPEKTLYFFPSYNVDLWLSAFCIQTLSPLFKNRQIVWEDCG